MTFSGCAENGKVWGWIFSLTSKQNETPHWKKCMLHKSHVKSTLSIKYISIVIYLIIYKRVCFVVIIFVVGPPFPWMSSCEPVGPWSFMVKVQCHFWKLIDMFGVWSALVKTLKTNNECSVWIIGMLESGHFKGVGVFSFTNTSFPLALCWTDFADTWLANVLYGDHFLTSTSPMW